MEFKNKKPIEIKPMYESGSRLKKFPIRLEKGLIFFYSLEQIYNDSKLRGYLKQERNKDCAYLVMDEIVHKRAQSYFPLVRNLSQSS